MEHQDGAHCSSVCHDFRVDLHVLHFLLAHHDGVLEMEVQQSDGLLLRALKNCVLDVAVCDV